MASTHTREDFLSIPINKRFVTAIEFLNKHADKPVTKREIIEKIGFSEASYTKIKIGARGLPKSLYNTAALVLTDYGIRPEWLLNGQGDMRTDKYLLREDSMIIELLRSELREKQKVINDLEQQLKEALAKLASKK